MEKKKDIPYKMAKFTKKMKKFIKYVNSDTIFKKEILLSEFSAVFSDFFCGALVCILLRSALFIDPLGSLVVWNY